MKSGIGKGKYYFRAGNLVRSYILQTGLGRREDRQDRRNDSAILQGSPALK
jgi:hypothetical protein